jgi:hypothetical protein
MYSPFILFILSFLCMTSCQKKSINESNSKNEILYHLNRGNTSDALKIIEAEKKLRPFDANLAMYEASVYAIEAGIDIYSIFPLLKLKFFKEPIANWDSLDKYDNPYGDIFEEKNPKKKSPEDNSKDKKDENIPADLLGDSEKVRKEEDQKIRSYLMTGLWGLYESIPILTLIPSVDLTKEKYALKAIDVLLNKELIFIDEKQKEERYQFLTLIEILMFITYLKDTIDLTNINSPNDLICNTDALKVVNNYKNIRSYALNLLTHSQFANLYDKKDTKKQENLTSAINMVQSTPEELDLLRKSRLSEDIYNSQESRCGK